MKAKRIRFDKIVFSQFEEDSGYVTVFRNNLEINIPFAKFVKDSVILEVDSDGKETGKGTCEVHEWFAIQTGLFLWEPS